MKQTSSQRHTPIALSLATLLAWLLGADSAAAAVPGRSKLITPTTGLEAWVYVPASLTAAPRPDAPAVVFLHGSGSSPTAWLPLLEPWAEQLAFVLVVPKAVSGLAFGVGDDRSTIVDALAALPDLLAPAALAVDPNRVALAGHSAGGGYALVLAYSDPGRFSAVWSLGAPFRALVDRRDDGYVPPALLYYGGSDPNYSSGSFTALGLMLSRLGVTWSAEVDPGAGHSGWTDEVFANGFSFLLAAQHDTPGPCVPGLSRLCLGAGRFAVEASWATASQGSGTGYVAGTQERDSGLFWFFAPNNWELTVKVLDGCAVNGHYWVFYSALSDVALELVVDDLVSGQQRRYSQPLGASSPVVLDTVALPCSP